MKKLTAKLQSQRLESIQSQKTSHESHANILHAATQKHAKYQALVDLQKKKVAELKEQIRASDLKTADLDIEI